MKALVDADTCTGCGLCADICPDIFDMGSDVAVVKVDPVPDSAAEVCREAADGCPVDAISLDD